MVWVDLTRVGGSKLDAIGEIVLKPRPPGKVASSSEHASCHKTNPLSMSGSWHELSKTGSVNSFV